MLRARRVISVLAVLATAAAQAAAQGPRMQPRLQSGTPQQTAAAMQPPQLDPFFSPVRPPRSIKQDSWIYIDEPDPREVRQHDLITIIVDEKSEVISNSRFNRMRQATLKAELKEFVRIGKTGNLRPAAEDQPTIDGNLNGRFNGTGQQTDQEGIRYRIAARVVDVLPNGNVVLEARKTIQTNRDVWSYTLTGELRSVDIQANNTALSENIYDLRITRMKTGKVNDSARLPWGSRLLDIIFPF
jgi:flagellar L-ring protein FlgH